MADPTEQGASPSFRPRGRVIPAAEIDAWQTGSAYLQEATREAERLREEAKDVVEHARQRGFDAGRQEGAKATARLLAETAARADQQLAQADHQIIDLALAVVRRVLGELDVDEQIARAITQALAQQRQNQPLTLHVPPNQADHLRTRIETMVDATQRHLITIEPDDHLKPGQCRLASDIGFVDLGIEAQLNALHQGLLHALDRRAAAAEEGALSS